MYIYTHGQPDFPHEYTTVEIYITNYFIFMKNKIEGIGHFFIERKKKIRFTTPNKHPKQ